MGPRGQRSRSEIENLPSMCEGLGTILSNTVKSRERHLTVSLLSARVQGLSSSAGAHKSPFFVMSY